MLIRFPMYAKRFIELVRQRNISVDCGEFVSIKKNVEKKLILLPAGVYVCVWITGGSFDHDH